MLLGEPLNGAGNFISGSVGDMPQLISCRGFRPSDSIPD
jgi:hypothetical protein